MNKKRNNFIFKLINLGVDKSLNFNERKKIKVSNGFSLVISLLLLLYIILLIGEKAWGGIILDSCFIIINIIALFLNYKKKFFLSRLILVICYSIILVFTGIGYGEKFGLELFLVLFVPGIFFFFDKMRHIILLNITLIIFYFIILISYLYVESPPLAKIDPYKPFVPFLNGIEVLILLFFFIKLFKDEHLNYQKEIEDKNTKLEDANITIKKSNKQIKDSINYASRIQRALIPEEKLFKEVFDDHFILYEPRDILSGDFYWIQKNKNNSILLAAADCTGHGIPGALLSVLGISFLNEIIKEFPSILPDQILNNLRIKIKQALISQYAGKGILSDGMDISLIKIDRKIQKIRFSGANNSLYLVTNDIHPSLSVSSRCKVVKLNNKYLHEVKADRQPIGNYIKEKPFTEVEFSYHIGDRLFMFSDGIIDQIGEESNLRLGSKSFKNWILESSTKDFSQTQDHITHQFEKWIGGRNDKRLDDILVIGIQL